LKAYLEKNPSQKNRAGGVPQSEGPEFKPQYHKKKKERKNERKKENRTTSKQSKKPEIKKERKKWNQTWWCTPVIPALESLRQENGDFEASVGYREGPCSREESKKRNRQACILIK
jgi:hypothetical protein